MNNIMRRVSIGLLYKKIEAQINDCNHLISVLKIMQDDPKSEFAKKADEELMKQMDLLNKLTVLKLDLESVLFN